MARDPALNGRPRQRLLAQVRDEEPNCHLCGRPIDLTLDTQRHPLASCVDELVPRSLGGSAIDRSNCRHAHRLCNEIRGIQGVTPTLHAVCRARVDRLNGTNHSRKW